MKSPKFICIFLLILLTFSCVRVPNPSKIIYLIPRGFTGGVIITYNQPDGITSEKTDDGSIIFRVPNDGLIKVKEPLNRDADYNFSYFFFNERGDKTPIEYLFPEHYVRNSGDITSKSFDTISEDETNNQIFAINHTIHNFGTGEQKVYIYSFIIEKPAIALQAFLKTQDRIFDIQIELSKTNNLQ